MVEKIHKGTFGKCGFQILRGKGGGGMVKKVVIWAGALAGLPHMARAEWTPLLASSSMDGIKADVGLAAAGIISVCLIVLGVGVLMRVLR